MPQRVLDRGNLFRWTSMVLVFSLLNSVWCFVHLKTTHTLDLGYISRMHLEPIVLFHILLNPLIGRLLGHFALVHIHRYLDTLWICSP